MIAVVFASLLTSSGPMAAGERRVATVAQDFSPALQSLSDAARRAEEQRRENNGPATVLKPPVVREDEDHPKLSEDLVLRYARARLALADLRKRDRGVQQRVIDSTHEIRHYEAFGDVLEGIPPMVALLDSFRLSPRLYVSTDATIRQMLDRRRSPMSYREPTERDVENLEFVRDHSYWVDSVMQQCAAHEKGLQLWWAAGPGWW